MALFYSLKQEIASTPAFVYDLDEIEKRLKLLCRIKAKSNCKVLYSVKALPLSKVLKAMKPLDGFSVSSLFEAKLAKEVYRNTKEIHFISPAIKDEQWKGIANIIHSLTFNSLEQFSRFENKLQNKSYGIRVNPELSFIKDSRYDPCIKFSKLGVPVFQLKDKISDDSKFFAKIEGLHLHTNCESDDFSHLVKTFEKIKKGLGDKLNGFKWLNLGGGYLFDKSENLSLFYDLLAELSKNYNFKDIIIEPGAFLVKDSGYLVSSVIDIFSRNGKNIAVLDTTVNHLPEVFEYQYEPDILGHGTAYKNRYILAGSSCLAGDVFGEYSFKNKLDIGSKVIFHGVGSYSLVKAHTFNGINLPDIYFIDKTKLKRTKRFTLEEYISHYRS